jgi:tetratricopeptide (TPR) repeat protein
MFRMTTLVLFLSLLCTLIWASAASVSASPYPQEKQPVLLHSGEIYLVTIDDIDAETLKVRLELDGKPVEATIPRSAIDPYSMYRILRERFDPLAAADHRKLGEFAREHGLWSIADRELRSAIELDPSLEESLADDLRDVENRLVAELVAEAEKRFEEGSNASARRIARFVLNEHAEAKGADSAKKLLREIRSRPARTGSGPDETESEASDTEGDGSRGETGPFARVRRMVEKAENYWTVALVRESGTGEPIDLLERSLSLLDDAKDRNEEILADVQDAKLVRAGNRLDERIRAQRIESHVSLGSLLVIRGSTHDALDHANRALALDPDSSDAKRLRDRIVAAAVSAGYYKNFRRRRP